MNNVNPLVTVRMPAYNHELYVEKAILSVVNQSFQDFEFIVVDDGSSDQTPFIIERLAKKYDFVFLRQKNCGLCATLNRILSLAKGNYLTGCASDDFYGPDRLEKQVAFMEAHPEIGVCHTNAIIVNEHEQELGPMNATNFYHDNWSEEQLAIKNTIIAPTVMVRTELIRGIGGYDESLQVEDSITWYKLIRLTKFHYLDQSLSYYRKHPANTTKNVWLMYQNQQAIYANFSQSPLHQKAKAARQFKWFCWLTRRHKREALKYLLPSLRYAGSRRFYRALYRLFLTR